MKQKNKEYKANLADEIDWKIIDQLHSATSRFSSASIEMKKIYFIVLGISVPAIIKLSDNNLDISLFITIYLLTITFWYLDSFTYYYQESLREMMDKRFKDIQLRNNEIQEEEKDEREFTLENDRIKKSRWKRSFLNSSVRLYHICFMLNTLGLILYLGRIIS